MDVFFDVFELNDRLVSAFVPVLTIFGLYRCFLRVL